MIVLSSVPALHRPLYVPTCYARLSRPIPGSLNLRMSGRHDGTPEFSVSGDRGKAGKSIRAAAAKLISSLVLIMSVLLPSRAGAWTKNEASSSGVNHVLQAGEGDSHFSTKDTALGRVQFVLGGTDTKHTGHDRLRAAIAVPPQVKQRSRTFMDGWRDAMEEKQAKKRATTASAGSRRQGAVLGEEEEGEDRGSVVERVLSAALAITLFSQFVMPRISEQRDRRAARGMRSRPSNTTSRGESIETESNAWLSDAGSQNERDEQEQREREAAIAAQTAAKRARAKPLHEYDFVVVGAGAAGLMAAGLAVSLGARTLLVEKGEIGGECTNSGCVPSKSILAAASLAASSKAMERLSSAPSNTTLTQMQTVLNETIRSAIPADPELSFKGLPGSQWVYDHARRVVGHVKSHETAEAIQAAGIHLLMGSASFKSLDTMTVEQRNGSMVEVRGKKYLICTGASPTKPGGAIKGLSAVKHWTYRDVFKTSEVPRSIIIVGAGPVGCELAQAYANMGTDVTLIGPRVLPRESEDVGRALEAILTGTHGVRVVKGRVVEALSKMPGEVTALLEGGKYITANRLLIAVGRTPNVRDLGLAKAGVQFSVHGVHVDLNCRTSNPRVWAAGDCCDNGGEMYSHFAGWQAYVATKNAVLPWWMNMGKDSGSITVVPRVTYTKPEVAQCGLSEELATRFYGPPGRLWHAIRLENSMSDRAMSEGEAPEGFIEVYVHRSGRVLGAVIVSNRAGELITEVTLAISLRLNVKQLALTLHPYPSHSFSLHKVWVDAAARNLVSNMSSGVIGRVVALFLGIRAAFRAQSSVGGKAEVGRVVEEESN